LHRCLVDVNLFDIEADVDFLDLFVEGSLDAEYTGSSSPHGEVINAGNEFHFSTGGGGTGNGFDVCCYYVPPSESPTFEPVPPPTHEPTHEPTPEPTYWPTEEPTSEPTYAPVPTEEPTQEPTRDPTEEPTPEPTYDPTTAEPTEEPTPEPTYDPTTAEPTEEPTPEPTYDPTTPEPTHDPTTLEPTNDPTIDPTEEPTAIPTLDNDFELDGPSNNEGNVWLNGKPVCDHGWDEANAMVVCRGLGFDKGVPRQESAYGPVVEDFIITEVNCVGHELSIWDCEFEVDPVCTSDEAAGVVCSFNEPSFFSDVGNVGIYLMLPGCVFICMLVYLISIIVKSSNNQEKEKKVQQVLAASPLPRGVEFNEGEGHETTPGTNTTAGDQEIPREGDVVTRTLTPVIRLTPRKTTSSIIKL